jgi:hypothetical protein
MSPVICHPHFSTEYLQLLFTAYCGFVLDGVHYGTGQHITEISSADFIIGMKVCRSSPPQMVSPDIRRHGGLQKYSTSPAPLSSNSASDSFSCESVSRRSKGKLSGSSSVPSLSTAATTLCLSYCNANLYPTSGTDSTSSIRGNAPALQ